MTYVEFRKGTYCYQATPRVQGELGLPNPRKWEPPAKDWKLPSDWKEIILKGMKDYLGKYRSARLFLDICVRCGACATCHYSSLRDPKNSLSSDPSFCVCLPKVFHPQAGF
jgi:hypothetical protein